MRQIASYLLCFELLPKQRIDVIFYVACFRVSFCNVSPSMHQDDTYLGSGSRVATFWERTAHSVNHIFSLLCPFVVLVVSN